MNELHLFAGAGGGILGGQLLGHTTVCAVELEEYPRRVLLQRQRDGILPRFPIWDDIRTFDANPWRGIADVVCGGFPCQDISAAGKGAGIEGKRSGLWGEMARVVREVRPRFVFVENSPILTSRGLGVVLGDLASMGYDARWCVLGADDAGAPHIRKRIWILANARCRRLSEQGEGEDKFQGGAEVVGPGPTAHSDCEPLREQQGRFVRKGGESEDVTGIDGKPGQLAHSNCEGLQGIVEPGRTPSQRREESDGPATESGGLWWESDPAERSVESRVGRVANGVANRVDRLKSLGNGQVPAVAALAWRTLIGTVSL